MAKTSSAIDLEPIDRLEEKVKLLVGLVDRLRAEQAKASDENMRLGRELDLMRERLSDAEHTAAEMIALREERDVIRNRVTEMLDQLDTLNL